MKHGFIGFGNLAKAIHSGLKKEKDNSFCYISKNNQHTGINTAKDINELIANSDIIWICVKPQNIKEVLTELKAIDLKGKTVVSPVAGKTIKFIELFLGDGTTIIRIMPNLAIAYQKSVTAFCTNNNSLTTAKIKTELEKLGKVIELPENNFDLFTAVFGSGPAFLLEIFKTFKSKIKELDVPDKLVDELLLGLLEGTTKYYKKNYLKKDIDELVKNVTSKGGTTEAGLQSFRKNELDKHLTNMIIEAKERSIKIKE